MDYGVAGKGKQGGAHTFKNGVLVKRKRRSRDVETGRRAHVGYREAGEAGGRKSEKGEQGQSGPA